MLQSAWEPLTPGRSLIDQYVVHAALFGKRSYSEYQKTHFPPLSFRHLDRCSVRGAKPRAERGGRGNSGTEYPQKDSVLRIFDPEFCTCVPGVLPLLRCSEGRPTVSWRRSSRSLFWFSRLGCQTWGSYGKLPYLRLFLLSIRRKPVISWIATQNRECLLWVCAVVRRRFPVGARPSRRTLQPEATGAVMVVTNG